MGTIKRVLKSHSLRATDPRSMRTRHTSKHKSKGGHGGVPVKNRFSVPQGSTAQKSGSLCWPGCCWKAQLIGRIRVLIKLCDERETDFARLKFPMYKER